MSSNYSIIVDKGEHHKDYGRHIFRFLLLGPNSTSNFSLKGLRTIGPQEKKF